MRLFEVSELRLALLVAGATFLGGFGSSVLGVIAVDAGTEKQTNVQLVKLAIGILSEKESEVDVRNASLRAWAVDTINSVSEVKFGEDARRELINGNLGFSVL